MKTFSIVRSMQVAYSLLFLTLLAVVVFLGYLSFEWFQPLSSNIRAPRFVFPLFIFAIICLPVVLTIFWAWLYLTAIRRGRLIFGKQVLVFESIKDFTSLLPPWLRPFRLSYDQIQDVRLGWSANLVQIRDLQGRSTTLVLSLFGGNEGEEVLVELKDHLPAERFMPGMEISEVRRKVSRMNKLSMVFSISVLVAILATFFFDPEFSSRPGLLHAWQVQQRKDVWTYSQDSQENFWTVSFQRDYYAVYHFSGKLDRKWKLPKDILEERYPSQVSGDRNGNPIIWVADGVYHYEAGGWQKIPYAQRLNLDYWKSYGVVSGEQGWTIQEQGEDAVLLKIDALTGQCSVLLPESAVEQQLHPRSLRRAVNGDLLVRMSGAQVDRVYVLSGDRWKPQEYSLALPLGNSVHDYFLDEKDTLWLLTETKTYQYQVVKIEATGEQYSTQLPSHQGEEDRGFYDSLLVDSYGRVWVSEYLPDAMTVFAPVWDGKATELVRYTYGNSNYQGSPSTPSVLLPNGMIWSFDKTITTMDTRVDSLPAPLPAWLADLNWNLVRIGVMLVIQLLMLLLFLYSFLDARAGQQGKRIKE